MTSIAPLAPMTVRGVGPCPHVFLKGLVRALLLLDPCATPGGLRALTAGRAGELARGLEPLTARLQEVRCLP